MTTLLLLTACSSPAAPPSPPAAAQPEAVPLKVLRELTSLPPVPSLPQWSPDSARVLFSAHGGDDNPHGFAAIIDVIGNSEPEQVSAWPSFVPAHFSPGGKAVVLAGPRQDVGALSTTLYLQPLDGGTLVDLLPGDQAVYGVSGTKFVEGWLDGHTLAFSEHVGTGVRELRFVDTLTQKLVESPDGRPLNATFFVWPEDRSRVAGQTYGGPATFWMWDFQAGRFLQPAGKLPGEFQWFEGWQGADTALFTAWAGYPYSSEATAVSLYQWDLKTGETAKLADDAILAQASGGVLAYVRRTPEPVLLVTDTAGKELRREPLGALPDDTRQWEHRPRLNGRHVAFQTGEGEWKLAPAGPGPAVTLHRGGMATVGFSPDGKRLALLVHDIPARLLLLENPLP
jgi:hypothetical protein